MTGVNPYALSFPENRRGRFQSGLRRTQTRAAGADPPAHPGAGPGRSAIGDRSEAVQAVPFLLVAPQGRKTARKASARR